jgi:hypothetical protein
VSEVLKSLPMYMMIGIVVVIGISQFNRLIGGILGAVFWIVVAVAGSQAYDQGGGIGLPGFMFPRELFYLICVLFAAYQAYFAYRAYVKKVRAPRGGPMPPVDEDTNR